MQTIKFETAKKLQDLNVKKKGYFSYVEYFFYSDTHIIIMPTSDKLTVGLSFKALAYTLDEILKMLPIFIYTRYDECNKIVSVHAPNIKVNFEVYRAYLEFTKCSEDEDIECLDNESIAYRMNYTDIDELNLQNNFPEFIHENPAEAAGQLLIWCIENGCIKVEELNNG